MRYRITSLVICCLLVASVNYAQSFQLIDKSNHANVTGATIMKQSGDNHGYVGYESLDVSIKLVNVSASTMTIGAKKIEHDTLQPDVSHTICFAGSCYPASTFVSTSHLTLLPGAADSLFLAHYLFNNPVHVRGLNHVSYVFYDINNPFDSAVVHVTYNTVVSASVSVEETANKDQDILAYPNPATDQVTFHYGNVPANTQVIIRALPGNNVISTLSLPQDENQVTINSTDLAAGLYYYIMISNDSCISRGKITVIH